MRCAQDYGTVQPYRSILVGALLALATADDALAQTTPRSPPRADYSGTESLEAAINQLARRYGAEVLYSSDLVIGLAAPQVNQADCFGSALAVLLAGSGLTAHRTAEGTYYLAKQPRSQTALLM